MSFSPKQFELVEKYAFSGVDLYTNPKTFANLEGDKYDYRIYGVADNNGVADRAIRFYINNDTGSNYRLYYMEGATSTALAYLNESFSFFPGLNSSLADAAGRNFCVIDIYGKSGQERAIRTFRTGQYSSDRQIGIFTSFWKNTIDQITSLKMFSDDTTPLTGEIYLFRKPKAEIYNASDWELVEEKIVSTQDMQGTPVNFTNLRGDTDEEYMLETLLTGTDAAGFTVSLNDDTTADNYTYQFLLNGWGVIEAVGGTSCPWLNSTGAGYTAINRVLIKAKSGIKRAMLHLGGSVQAFQQGLTGFWWANTADELHKITVTASNTYAQTGSLRLYRRSKKQTSSAHERLIFDYDISGDFSAGQTIRNIKIDKIYRIEVTSNQADSEADRYMLMQFNGDTGANYISQSLTGETSTASASTATSSSVQILCHRNSYPGVSTNLLFPTSGKYRPMLQEIGYANTIDTRYITVRGIWWTNTADAIQTIKIYASTTTSITGNIKVWEINLQS